MDIDKLARALRRAGEAALAADPSKDSGEQNLDAVGLRLAEWKDHEVQQAAAAGGVGLTPFEWCVELWWWVDVPAYGTAARRRIMMEAACRSLQEDDWDAAMFRMME
jgi:hypothetical protein